MTNPGNTKWFRSPETRGDTGCAPEFPVAPVPQPGMDRRSFLRLTGFSFAAAGAAACSRAVPSLALPQVTADEHVVPGRDYWIASTSWADGSGSGVLVRCLDGRPLKLEGNPDHPLNQGGLTASCQASLLSLYDDRRFDGPQRAGAPGTWDDVDGALRAELERIRSDGGRVRVLTPTLTGPSTLARIATLLDSVPDGRHVMYDALSCSALLDAQRSAHGVRVLPRYDLARADVLAVFDADPLGTWISPAEYSAGYRASRQPDASPPRMSRHWQFEARLSLTGSRADQRVLVAPWETRPALTRLARAVAERSGTPVPGPAQAATDVRPELHDALDSLATELWAHRGAGLVLCGRNDHHAQVLVCWINELLGNVGNTVLLDTPSQQRRGDDRALAALRDELLAGDVDLLITSGNPAYELPGLAQALGQAGTLACTSAQPDETSALADLVFPESHELERWDDSEPHAGLFATTQPTLPPLRDGRTLRASFARWAGDARDDRTLLRDAWERDLAPRRQAADEPFGVWFDRVLERGWVSLPGAPSTAARACDAAAVATALAAPRETGPQPAGADGLGLVLYPKVGLLDGRGAHNPWLQELPDPISKVTWDNHADLSPATADRLGLRTGDVVRVTIAAPSDSAQAAVPAPIELPVLVQPGQDDRVVAIALGYGRMGTDRFTDVGPQWFEGRPTVAPGATVGSNAAPFLTLDDGVLGTDRRVVRLTPTGEQRLLATTQDHHSLAVPEHLAPKGGEVRDAVHLTTLDAATVASHAGGHDSHAELWSDDFDHGLPHWGLAVDLTACTGCSACVVSCQAENNVPVVGRDEVQRHREMSWIRIDRYYADRDDGGVDVVHQPMMCQHCGHAPCETVCPVLATMHSSEGLNTQVYNRCVGTRYCANNCPYKTRRFNWFEYSREDRLQNMALNPDVTIRSRGVMEKCSMCVQRIQAGKAEARRRGVALADGDVQTACQQSCPTRAIVFGDLHDPESAVSKLAAKSRAYSVLGELNVQPSVRYLADVRNPATEGA